MPNLPSSQPSNLPRIDRDRLWNTITETARFGGTERGGIRRLALSEEDREVRDWLVGEARGHGYAVGIDEIGNIYVERAGRDPSRPAIAIGSHLDTQPTGGRFDGVLGVLAGLEVLRSLDDAGIETEAPVCLVNWTNEEGARFAPGEMGSEVYAGAVTPGFALSRTDRDGISVSEALDAIGYRGRERCGERRFSAMVELHIEQGPVLEAEDIPIGVVVAAAGQIWFDGVVSGRESHAGTTPMSLRRDALCAFSELALAVESTAAAEEARGGVGTIGIATVAPGSRNTVPGVVRFSLELRHPDARGLASMHAAVQRATERIGEKRGCDFVIEQIWSKKPVQFSAAVAAAVRDAAGDLRLTHRDMISGAGHDACAVAECVPTAMIFVPCEGGISHNEAENATPEWCAAGADVLFRTVLHLAGIPR